MTITKETKSLSMPWEQEYGYSQVVKVGDTKKQLIEVCVLYPSTL